MNKEKLINIILKDIDELKDISEEIKKDNPSQKLETDIALSKATIILQEFQLLKEKYVGENSQNNVNSAITLPVSEVKTEEKPQEKPVVQPEAEIVEEQKPEPKETVAEPMIIIDEEADTEEFHEEEEDTSSEKTDHELVEIIESSEAEEENLYEEEEEEEEDDDDDDDESNFDDEDENEFDDDDEVDDDEVVAPPPYEKRTVGENFHVGISLNDRIGHANTLDQKISHSPINSLQSAIGINDRFLFIREMFNNDSALYASAIKRIDNCENITEAVDYLRANFKFKKTDASLKFAELIKRRFSK